MAHITVDNLAVTYHKTEPRPGLTGRIADLFSPVRTQVHALRGVSFVVEAGECVGYIGPNGSGKTTTIKALSGVLRPSGGSARVLGYEPIGRDPRYLAQIGLILGAKSQLWADLPAMDTFLFLKEVYRLGDAEFKARLDHLCELFGVTELIRTPVRLLSQGERVRMQLICAVLHGPRVLFMDEPTYGLDIWAQAAVRDFTLKAVKELGTTVLLTSHNLDDIDRLCERIIVLNEGQIVYDGKKAALRAQFDALRKVSISGDAAAALKDCGIPREVLDEGPEGTTFIVGADQLGAVHRAIGPGASVSVESVPLEYMIRKLVGR